MKPTTFSFLSFATGVAAECALPSSYRWSSSGVLALPKNGWVSLKDLTTAPYNGKHLIYATNYGTAWRSMAFSLIDNFSQLGSASQTRMTQATFAPSLFFFRPKNISSEPKRLVICADSLHWEHLWLQYGSHRPGRHWRCSQNMYMFFCGDNGKIYRASMPIGNFPGASNYATVISNNLFEAVQVYTYGTNKYLMIVEAIGSNGRFFRSFTATSLGSSWTVQARSEGNHSLARLIAVRPRQWHPYWLDDDYDPTTPTSMTISTTKTTTTTTLTSTSTSTPGTVPQWGQCGGQGYTGATPCQSPYTCSVISQWYSQCI